MNAADFSVLAEEPEIGLSELHKIKTRSKFGNNNPADPSLTTIDIEDIDHAECHLVEELIPEKTLENLHR